MTTHEQHDLKDEVAPVAAEPQIDDEVPPVAAEPQIDDEVAPAVAEPQFGDQNAVAREPVPAADQHELSADTGLFADNDVADLRARWAGVQAAFVDDPKDCVQQADHLVSDLVEQLTTGFAQARSRLEEEWSHGRDASTEDLRVALMHYREFFDRLLGV
jgi:hypothetical protein